MLKRTKLLSVMHFAVIVAILGTTDVAYAANPETSKPFVIGAIVSGTGPYSQDGKSVEKGLKAGVKYVNEHGGILGRHVTLLVRDDAGNPGRALLAAKELISDQHVDFLYTEIISGLALAVLPYTTEQKQLTITNGASAQLGDVTRFPYSFQLLDSAKRRVPAVISALKHLGGHKVGILVSTNPPQKELGNGLKAELPKYGMDVVGLKLFDVDTKDLSPQLQGLRDAGADIIAFDGPGRDHVRVVMTGMQTLGWKAKVVAEPADIHGDLTQQVPTAVKNQFYSVQYRISTRTGELSPKIQSYVKNLAQLGPIDNLAFCAAATDVVTMVKWAYETSQKENGNINADSLKSVIEGIDHSDFASRNPLLFDKPGYSAKDHTTYHADYTNFWGLMHTSKPVDGRYAGEDLDLLKPTNN